MDKKKYFRWTLTALGAASAVLYAAALRLPDWRADTPTFLLIFAALYFFALAAWLVARRAHDDRRVAAIIIVAATIFRLLICVSPPTLSDDIFRYVYDGRLQLAGISPYTYAPNNPHLSKVRDSAGYANMGDNRNTLAVYQPVSQVLFAAAAAAGGDQAVYVIKGALVLFDLGTVLLILGILRQLRRPPGLAILYAWSPLVVFEIAGSGHIDGLAIFFGIAGVYVILRGRRLTGGALAGLAVATKLLPASLIPALNRRPWDWRPALTAVGAIFVTYAPYLVWGGSPLPFNNASGGLAFNQGLKTALIWLVGGPGRAADNVFAVLSGGLLLGAGIYFWSRRKSAAGVVRAAFWLTGLLIILLPYTVPWYLVLWLPFVALEESAAGVYLAGAVMLSYLFYTVQPWGLAGWVQPLEFIPFFILLVWDYRRLSPGRLDLETSVNNAELDPA